jgi:hypothetical protein
MPNAIEFLGVEDYQHIQDLYKAAAEGTNALKKYFNNVDQKNSPKVYAMNKFFLIAGRIHDIESTLKKGETRTILLENNYRLTVHAPEIGVGLYEKCGNSLQFIKSNFSIYKYNTTSKKQSFRAIGQRHEVYNAYQEGAKIFEVPLGIQVGLGFVPSPTPKPPVKINRPKPPVTIDRTKPAPF